MSFGNLQLHHLELGELYDYDRSYGKRHYPRRHIEAGQRLQPVRESSATIRAVSQTNLTVVTAEGDQVTLSLAAQAKFAAASRSGPNGSSQAVATSVSSQLRVAVEGDLSETELNDLAALINAVDNATSQAESTGVPDASAVTASFAGLESLAAFAYSYNQTVEAGIHFGFNG